MRARLGLAVAVVAFVALVAQPAGADTRPPGDGGAYVDDEGNPTATAEDGIHPDAGGSGGGGQSDCHWQVVIDDDFEFFIYDVDSLQPKHSATGRWLQQWCEGTGAVAIVPEGGLVDPAALAAQALASVGIEPAQIHTSPSSAERLYVQMPTWLWIDGSWWQSYEATARAGRVTSTVVAEPVSTTWLPGDGHSLRCAGPGTAWRAGLAEDASDCTYTYRSSSAGQPDGTFLLQATVQLEISWSSNSGAGGTLPAINRTSTMPVEVGEIQAIGTE